MSKKGDNCAKKIEPPCVENEILMIPYAAHQSAAARQERQIKRMWIALIVAVALLFISNMAWLIYESQFVTVSYEQDGNGINNVNVGEQGDINNGAESEDKVQEEQ